jgi:hypothetical protein
MHPDAAALGDHRPVSLINIFAKIVAKTLASRLAPRKHTGGYKTTRLHSKVVHPRQLYVGSAHDPTVTQDQGT